MTALPPSLPPEGLGRAQAAAFCGLSPNSFDAAVKDGGMLVKMRYVVRKKDADLEDPMMAALSRFVADRAN